MGQCVTNFEYVYIKYYGFDILLSLSIIGAMLVLYLVVVLFRKISEHEQDFNADTKFDSHFQKRLFRLEDLPFHEIRLYCEGENHPFKPWVISDEAKDNFLQ